MASYLSRCLQNKIWDLAQVCPNQAVGASSGSPAPGRTTLTSTHLQSTTPLQDDVGEHADRSQRWSCVPQTKLEGQGCPVPWVWGLWQQQRLVDPHCKSLGVSLSSLQERRLPQEPGWSCGQELRDRGGRSFSITCILIFFHVVEKLSES